LHQTRWPSRYGVLEPVAPRAQTHRPLRGRRHDGWSWLTKSSCDDVPADGCRKKNGLQHFCCNPLISLAEWTGLEPATPGVTGRYSNQLNYHSLQLLRKQILGFDVHPSLQL
jgi:hypothetical protein